MSEQGIQNIVNEIVAGFKPEKVVLFGSHAWGKPMKDSDVDILVVKDDPKKTPGKWPLILNVFCLSVKYLWIYWYINLTS